MVPITMNLVEIFKILLYISLIVWLLPPFRQWKSKFFYFFLILAVADPLSIFITLYISKNINFYYPLISLLLLISIIDYRSINKQKNFLIYVIILASSTLMILVFIHSGITIVILHFIISMVFLKDFIFKYVFQREFSVFYAMLLFYEFTIILKFFNVILGFTDATAFFIITSIFQITFGLFFSIFREDKACISFKH